MVFLVNAESVDAAKTHVHGLPTGQAGLRVPRNKAFQGAQRRAGLVG